MEELVVKICGIFVNVFHLLAILVLSVGSVKAMFTYLKDAVFGEESAEAIQESRFELGHSFSLGLGFLIGGSILKTTIAPTWDDIGKLAAIIALRTILNYFLLREIGSGKKKHKADKKAAEQPA
ncbi:hypothetical protein BVX97_03950 [bacterium E08(2017)]|nr:hypothetical protein BVX97_03950 [bacterium E08(2017)]